MLERKSLIVVLAGLTISQHNTPLSVTVTFTVPTTTGRLVISLHNSRRTRTPLRLGLKSQGLFGVCKVFFAAPLIGKCHHCQQALRRHDPRQKASLLIRQFRKGSVECENQEYDVTITNTFQIVISVQPRRGFAEMLFLGFPHLLFSFICHFPFQSVEYRVGSGGIASWVCFFFCVGCGHFWRGLLDFTLCWEWSSCSCTLCTNAAILKDVTERNKNRNSWSARKVLDCTFWVSLFLMSMRDRSSVRVAV